MPDPGTFLAVVGPSGAGKDTLISEAQHALKADPRFCFVRRFITRSEDSEGEDHIALSEEEFEARSEAGAFALTWTAHELSYGVPREVFELTARGAHVICNLSRGALPEAEGLFARFAVVHVTAPPDVLAARLAGRKRDDANAIRRRLQRGSPALKIHSPMMEIENIGPIKPNGQRFIQALYALSEKSA